MGKEDFPTLAADLHLLNWYNQVQNPWAKFEYRYFFPENFKQGINCVHVYANLL